MSYNVMDVAKYIIVRCSVVGNPVSNLQLQKILYYVQLNFLKSFGKVAFKEPIEAWRHGPVVPAVYWEYNIYGRQGIELSSSEDCFNIFQNDDEEKLTNLVIDACLSLDPWELVQRSHTPDGPWDRTYDGTFNNEIPVRLMKEHVGN